MTISNVIYENGMLTALLFDGGDVSFTKSGTGIHTTYHFYMKDHLGIMPNAFFMDNNEFIRKN